jgi:Icc-related predicted phosphoesterase
LHHESVRQLRSFLSQHDPQRTIVVTHHAPSLQSVPSERRLDPESCGYASSLEDLILEAQPRLWMHGHVHRSADYSLSGTRVLANPRGYPDSLNPAFDPRLLVNLDDAEP